MYGGEIAERGPVKKVLSNPKHPYTEMLLGTLLTLESKKEQVSLARATTREVSHAVTPNACKYSGRCKYAFDRCFKERPLLKQVEEGREVACHKFN